MKQTNAQQVKREDTIFNWLRSHLLTECKHPELFEASANELNGSSANEKENQS
jgi:hypothetical protein